MENTREAGLGFCFMDGSFNVDYYTWYYTV